MSKDTCSKCGKIGVLTVNSRASTAGRFRRKHCEHCNTRYSTVERVTAAWCKPDRDTPPPPIAPNRALVKGRPLGVGKHGSVWRSTAGVGGRLAAKAGIVQLWSIDWPGGVRVGLFVKTLQCFTYLDKAGRWQRCEPAPEYWRPLNGPPRNRDAENTWAEYREAAQAPARNRFQVFTAMREDGKSYEQIAIELGLSSANYARTIYNRYRHKYGDTV